MLAWFVFDLNQKTNPLRLMTGGLGDKLGGYIWDAVTANKRERERNSAKDALALLDKNIDTYSTMKLSPEAMADRENIEAYLSQVGGGKLKHASAATYEDIAALSDRLLITDYDEFRETVEALPISEEAKLVQLANFRQNQEAATKKFAPILNAFGHYRKFREENADLSDAEAMDKYYQEGDLPWLHELGKGLAGGTTSGARSLLEMGATFLNDINVVSDASYVKHLEEGAALRRGLAKWSEVAGDDRMFGMTDGEILGEFVKAGVEMAPTIAAAAATVAFKNAALARTTGALARGNIMQAADVLTRGTIAGGAYYQSKALSAGGVYGQYVDQLASLEGVAFEDMDEEQKVRTQMNALTFARHHAHLNGVQTAVVSGLIGAEGAYRLATLGDKVARESVAQALKKAYQKAGDAALKLPGMGGVAGGAVKGALVGAAMEGVEEFVDELGHGIRERILINPSMGADELLGQAIFGAFIGSGLGAVSGGVTGGIERHQIIKNVRDAAGMYDIGKLEELVQTASIEVDRLEASLRETPFNRAERKSTEASLKVAKDERDKYMAAVKMKSSITPGRLTDETKGALDAIGPEGKDVAARLDEKLQEEDLRVAAKAAEATGAVLPPEEIYIQTLRDERGDIERQLENEYFSDEQIAELNARRDEIDKQIADLSSAPSATEAKAPAPAEGTPASTEPVAADGEGLVDIGDGNSVAPATEGQLKGWENPQTPKLGSKPVPLKLDSPLGYAIYVGGNPESKAKNKGRYLAYAMRETGLTAEQIRQAREQIHNDWKRQGASVAPNTVVSVSTPDLSNMRAPSVVEAATPDPQATQSPTTEAKATPPSEPDKNNLPVGTVVESDQYKGDIIITGPLSREDGFERYEATDRTKRKFNIETRFIKSVKSLPAAKPAAAPTTATEAAAPSAAATEAAAPPEGLVGPRGGDTPFRNRNTARLAASSKSKKGTQWQAVEVDGKWWVQQVPVADDTLQQDTEGVATPVDAGGAAPTGVRNLGPVKIVGRLFGDGGTRIKAEIDRAKALLSETSEEGLRAMIANTPVLSSFFDTDRARGGKPLADLTRGEILEVIGRGLEKASAWDVEFDAVLDNPVTLEEYAAAFPHKPQQQKGETDKEQETKADEAEAEGQTNVLEEEDTSLEKEPTDEQLEDPRIAETVAELEREDEIARRFTAPKTPTAERATPPAPPEPAKPTMAEGGAADRDAVIAALRESKRNPDKMKPEVIDDIIASLNGGKGAKAAHDRLGKLKAFVAEFAVNNMGDRRPPHLFSEEAMRDGSYIAPHGRPMTGQELEQLHLAAEELRTLANKRGPAYGNAVDMAIMWGDLAGAINLLGQEGIDAMAKHQAALDITSIILPTSVEADVNPGTAIANRATIMRLGMKDGGIYSVGTFFDAVARLGSKESRVWAGKLSQLLGTWDDNLLIRFAMGETTDAAFMAGNQLVINLGKLEGDVTGRITGLIVSAATGDQLTRPFDAIQEARVRTFSNRVGNLMAEVRGKDVDGAWGAYLESAESFVAGITTDGNFQAFVADNMATPMRKVGSLLANFLNSLDKHTGITGGMLAGWLSKSGRGTSPAMAVINRVVKPMPVLDKRLGEGRGVSFPSQLSYRQARAMGNVPPEMVDTLIADLKQFYVENGVDVNVVMDMAALHRAVPSVNVEESAYGAYVDGEVWVVAENAAHLDRARLLQLGRHEAFHRGLSNLFPNKAEREAFLGKVEPVLRGMGDVETIGGRAITIDGMAQDLFGENFADLSMVDKMETIEEMLASMAEMPREQAALTRLLKAAYKKFMASPSVPASALNVSERELWNIVEDAVRMGQRRAAGREADFVGSDTTGEATVDDSMEPSLDLDVVKVRGTQIAARPELMQFKGIDDLATGVNKRDKLEGKWDKQMAGVLLVWEPNDPSAYDMAEGERYIVANGHHRLAFGQSLGVPEYSVWIMKESDGHTAKDAMVRGALLNIADGKGTAQDQAKFLRNSKETFGKTEAIVQGNAVGSRGRNARDIAFNASDALFTAFINEQISETHAAQIANAAPENEGAQRAGLRAALKGEAPAFAANVTRASQVMGVSVKEDQMDLFGEDDSAMQNIDRMAADASAIQAELGRLVSSVSGAVNNPGRAKQLGIDVNDPESIKRTLDKLKAEERRWASWPMQKDITDTLVAGGIDRDALVAGILSRAKAKERVGDGEFGFAPDIFNLAPEEDNRFATAAESDAARAKEEARRAREEGTDSFNFGAPLFSRVPPEQQAAMAAIAAIGEQPAPPSPGRRPFSVANGRLSPSLPHVASMMDEHEESADVALQGAALLALAADGAADRMGEVRLAELGGGDASQGRQAVAEATWALAHGPDNLAGMWQGDELVRLHALLSPELQRRWQETGNAYMVSTLLTLEHELGAEQVEERVMFKRVEEKTDDLKRGQSVREILQAHSLVRDSDVLALLGDYPSYLNDVTDFILGQKQKWIEGKFTARDLAKAYIITVASQGSDAVGLDTIQKALPDFNPDEDFLGTGASGRVTIRPEEAMAFWFSTDTGQRALDAIEQGIVDDEAWAEAHALRKVFGDDRLGNIGVNVDEVGRQVPVFERLKSKKLKLDQDGNPIPKLDDEGNQVFRTIRLNPKTQANLRNISVIVDEVNKSKGDWGKMEKAMLKMRGIGSAKKAFMGHLLGFGGDLTLDAVEINFWLTGAGDTSQLGRGKKKTKVQIKREEYLREIVKAVTDNPGAAADLSIRIKRAFRRLKGRNKEIAAIPDDVFMHVMHHWLWDRAKGIETTHIGMMRAQVRFKRRLANDEEALLKSEYGWDPGGVFNKAGPMSKAAHEARIRMEGSIKSTASRFQQIQNRLDLLLGKGDTLIDKAGRLTDVKRQALDPDLVEHIGNIYGHYRNWNEAEHTIKETFMAAKKAADNDRDVEIARLVSGGMDVSQAFEQTRGSHALAYQMAEDQMKSATDAEELRIIAEAKQRREDGYKFVEKWMRDNGRTPEQVVEAKALLHEAVDEKGKIQRQVRATLKRDLALAIKRLNQMQLDKKGETRAAESLRSYINITKKQEAAIGKRGDLYLHRSYMFFDSPTYRQWLLGNDQDANAKIDAAASLLWDMEKTSMENRIRAQGKDDNYIIKYVGTPEARAALRSRVRRRLLHYFSIGKASSVDTTFHSKLGEKDDRILRQKDSIPDEILELWGVNKDPRINLTRTAQHLADFIHKDQFLHDILAIGKQAGWLARKEEADLKDKDAQAAADAAAAVAAGVATRPKGDIPLAARRMEKWVPLLKEGDDDVRFSPLVGWYAPEYIVRLFRPTLGLADVDMEGGADKYKGAKLWHRRFKMLTGYQMAKVTIYSPKLAVRNFFSATLPYMVNGNLNPIDGQSWSDLAGAFRLAIIAGTGGERLLSKRDAAKNKAMRDELQWLSKNGIIDDNALVQIMRKLTIGERKAMMSDLDLIEREMGGRVATTKTQAKRAIKRLHRFAESVYQGGDEVFKIGAFKSELRTIQEAYPNETVEQQRLRAADKVKRTQQTYSHLPQIARQISETAIIAPFVSFSIISTMMLYNSIAIGVEEMKSGIPVLQRRGAWRVSAASFFGTAGLAGAIAIGSWVLGQLDPDDEEKEWEDEDLRPHLADWEKNNAIKIVEAKDGRVKYTNWSHMDFYSAFNKVVQNAASAAFSDKPAGDKVLDTMRAVVGSALDPFNDPQLFLNTTVAIISGAEIPMLGQRGRTIYSSSDNAQEKIGAVAQHLARTMIPLYSDIERPAIALTGGEVGGQKLNVMDEVLFNTMLGLRVREIDIVESTEFQMGQISREWNDIISSNFNKHLR
jgi:hypothetical protein